jgi:hypothetical protein
MCACGAKLQIPDEDIKKWVSCPACRVIVSLPPEDGIRAAAAATTATSAAVRSSRPPPFPPPFPPPLPEPAEEESNEEDLEDRRRRRKAKARRQYLEGINVGLALHYVVPFVSLVGIGTGVLALISSLNSALLEWESADEAALGFFVASGVFLFLAGSLALPAALFGLLASPNGSGRRPLMSGVGLFAAGTLAAAILIVRPRFGLPLFAAGLGCLFGGWAYWLVFLGCLGPALKRPEVAEGARRTLLAGVRMLAVGIPFLLTLGILVGLGLRRPWLIPVAPGPFLGAVALIAWHVGNFDSLLDLFLAPTGIPFTFEYLNFISGMRVLLERVHEHA